MASWILWAFLTIETKGHQFTTICSKAPVSQGKEIPIQSKTILGVLTVKHACLRNSTVVTRQKHIVLIYLSLTID